MGWLREWKYHLGNGKEADVSAKMKKKGTENVRDSWKKAV